MATAELYVNYSLHERFLHFCADIQEFHDLFSWHTAPLRDWRIPLATGVVYTLIVLLWAWRRPPPPEKGSFEAERQAVIDKNTDLILKPFLNEINHDFTWTYIRPTGRPMATMQRWKKELNFSMA